MTTDLERLIVYHENHVLPVLSPGDMWLVYPRVLNHKKPQYSIVLLASRPDEMPGQYALVRTLLSATRITLNDAVSERDALMHFKMLERRHAGVRHYFTPNLFTNVRQALVYVRWLGRNPRWTQ